MYGAVPELKGRTMPQNDSAFSLADLSKNLANTNEQALERGFQVPIYCTAVGADGSLVAAHYYWAEENLECRIVAQYLPHDGIPLPIHLILLDGTADHAARALIATAEQSTFPIQIQ